MTRSTPQMTNPEAWLDAYAQLREPGPGHPSEWLGTPLAVAGLVMWLWSLPTPAEFGPAVNWATMFLVATTVYYFIVSLTLAFGALPFIAATAVIAAWLDRSALPLGQVGITVFVVAIAWQMLASRRSHGGGAVFLRLQYLMIGPLWLLAAAFRRAGIPY